MAGAWAAGQWRRAAAAVAGLIMLCGVGACSVDVTSGTEASSSARTSGIIPSGGAGIPADAIIVEASISDGVVSPAANQVQIPLGTRVQLLITSDTEDDAHVHGYDLTLDLAADKQAELEFIADVAGDFVVELHGAGQLLCDLQVA